MKKGEIVLNSEKFKVLNQACNMQSHLSRKRKAKGGTVNLFHSKIITRLCETFQTRLFSFEWKLQITGLSCVISSESINLFCSSFALDPIWLCDNTSLWSLCTLLDMESPEEATNRQRKKTGGSILTGSQDEEWQCVGSIFNIIVVPKRIFKI